MKKTPKTNNGTTLLRNKLIITGSIARSATRRYLGRPILRFFAPQGRHVAPMGVKFGMEQPLLHAKFHPHRCNNKGVGPQKLKFLVKI